jgi:hypothetical protein
VTVIDQFSNSVLPQSSCTAGYNDPHGNWSVAQPITASSSALSRILVVFGAFSLVTPASANQHSFYAAFSSEVQCGQRVAFMAMLDKQ